MKERRPITFPLWMDVIVYMDGAMKAKNKLMSVVSIYKGSGYMTTYLWLLRMVVEFEARKLVTSHVKGSCRLVTLTVRGAQTAACVRKLKGLMGEDVSL
jgi:hypothetical protein